MGTTTIVDLRRTDLRTNVLENPYWITSGELDKDAKDKAALFFSFPVTGTISPGFDKHLILLHEMWLEVTTAFTSSSTKFSIGQGYIANDGITTGGVSTDGTVAGNEPDDYMVEGDGDADIIVEGWHQIDTSSVYLTAIAAATWGSIASITPIDANVLCIQGYLKGTTLTAGAARLHVLTSVVPSNR